MFQLPESYVVVDVETTGLRPWAGDRVIEIGAVRVQRGVVTAIFWHLVNPGMPIPLEVQAIHGITDAAVRDQPAIAEVLPRFFTFVQRLPLVAHFAAFDRSFLEAECQTCRLPHPVGPYVCTVALSRRLYPHLPRHNLDALVRYFRIPISNRHRALGDVVATQRLYDVLRRQYFAVSIPGQNVV